MMEQVAESALGILSQAAQAANRITRDEAMDIARKAAELAAEKVLDEAPVRVIEHTVNTADTTGPLLGGMVIGALVAGFGIWLSVAAMNEAKREARQEAEDEFRQRERERTTVTSTRPQHL